ncbi:hypothetical protein NADFUDRAFT_61268 [Nadsonia fulvescens var. elongata DSM 6958]|uniref:Polyadenylate-binding protein, cytoplasmic and nuclear n=1 Tax=Nadsonia fulvescens var. elongata DSM 6958 TaxID=857566 RepID=A0A1E3PGI7_9ASCO|nr:hypothetical protein NADFUDRAFT_61268 [Nadsonia fulvescens var. elongata DSM 6958]
MTCQPLVSISSVDLIHSAEPRGEAKKFNTKVNAKLEPSFSSTGDDHHCDYSPDNQESETSQDEKAPMIDEEYLPNEYDLSSPSLFIGNLDRTITDADLQKVFGSIGPFFSIKVCEPKTTESSRGYAYVNYIHLHDAIKAIQLLDDQPIFINESDKQLHDPTLRIQVRPAQRKELTNNGNGNCQVENLHQYAGNQAFLDLFSHYGTINEYKIFIQHDRFTPHITVGFGYLDYDTKESVNAAVNELNGKQVGDFTLNVGFHKFKPNRHNNTDDDTYNTNIFIKGFSEDLTQDEFKNIFSKEGHYKIVNVSFPSNAQTKKSAGYGFLKLISNEKCREFILEFNGKDILLDGRCILHHGQPHQQYHQYLSNQYYNYNQNSSFNYSFDNNSTVYVKNLDNSVSEADLLQKFEPLGNVISHKIMFDDQGRSRGFGFIKYQDATSSLSAINKLNNQVLGSRRMFVSAAQRTNTNRGPHIDKNQTGEGKYYDSRYSGPSNRGYSGRSNRQQNQNFDNMSRPNHSNRNHHQYTTSSLAAVIASAANPLAQREIMGEEIYPKVLTHARIAGNAQLASVITGVILELTVSDLLNWVDDESHMNRVIMQAHDAYLKYQTKVA